MNECEHALIRVVIHKKGDTRAYHDHHGGGGGLSITCNGSDQLNDAWCLCTPPPNSVQQTGVVLIDGTYVWYGSTVGMLPKTTTLRNPG